MTATPRQPRRRHFESENGFTLVEFMIAALIMSIVLGGTVALATRIQQAYGTQLDDVAVEQEARFALDWIARDLRSAASNPYEIPGMVGLVINPDGALPADDSIRVQADIGALGPDGVLDDAGEVITIAPDTANWALCSPGTPDTTRCTSVTRQDPFADDPAALAMTEAIFTNLIFTYRNAAYVPLTAAAAAANPELVTYVRVQVTARSRARNPYAPIGPFAPIGQYTTSTLATEVRLRTR